MPSVQSVPEPRGGDKLGSAADVPQAVTWICVDSAATPHHGSFQVSKGTPGGWNFPSFTFSLPSVVVQRVPGHV